MKSIDSSVPVMKAFAIFFATMTVFMLGYFLTGILSPLQDHSVISGGDIVLRGTNTLVFAYITYNIHVNIRNQIRYERDRKLYDKVNRYLLDRGCAIDIDGNCNCDPEKLAQEPPKKADDPAPKSMWDRDPTGW